MRLCFGVGVNRLVLEEESGGGEEGERWGQGGGSCVCVWACVY